MRRASMVALATVWLAAACTPLFLHAAPRKERKEKSGERVWTHPEFARFGVGRIAMLPVASYNHDAPSEKLVEAAVGQALRESGYRWMSPGTTRELLRDSEHGDSLLEQIQQSVLKGSGVDSLMAPWLCARLRCDAVLSERIDQWEQHELEWDQSGKSSTTIQIRSALVDSTGSLLWSVASSETAEGPYHDGSANPIGVSGGDLQRRPITGQGGAPAFLDVVTTVCKRWAPLFPAKSAADSSRAAQAKGAVDSSHVAPAK